MENGNGNGKATREMLDALKAKYDAKIIEVQAETLKIREEMALFREMANSTERRVDLVEYTQDRDEERLLRMEEVGPYLLKMLNRQDERLDLQRFERDIQRQELDEKLKELAEAQKQSIAAQQHSDERLNAFILVLERYIEENRQRRNGGNHNNG